MDDTSPRLNRRHTLAAGLACLLPARVRAARAPALLAAPAAATTPAAQPLPELAALEQRTGGRLGVALFNTATGALAGHRLDERFAMCSTFKLPLAAVVLRQIDQGRLRARQWVPYTAADIVAHAPVARAQLARGGMTVQALAEAAQTTSDNTAANLLLGLIGGPAGFTTQWRAAGDSVTRLDRMEPQMNLVLPGDPRDTTTPAAMAQSLAKWLTGDLLTPASRALLIAWMVATRTGLKRLRAGLPPDWRAGDKTGTAMAEGMTDKYNDVAITWPAASQAPLFISAYFETAISHGGRMRDEDQAVLAEVGRIAARWVPVR
jgi:beta-lactamase class A